MAWTPENHIELWKFPLTVVVTIATLALTSWLLDLRPSALNYGDLSIEFQEQIRKELLISNLELNEKGNIGQASLNYDSLFDSYSASPIEQSGNSLAVNDNIAELSYVQEGDSRKNIFNSVEGYIWIGNTDTNTNNFSKSKLNDINSLNQLDIGGTYIVNGNMVIRENSPTENPRYYLGEKQVGLAPIGTKIKVLGTAARKPLTNYDQIWIKIRVTE